MLLSVIILCLMPLMPASDPGNKRVVASAAADTTRAQSASQHPHHMPIRGVDGAIPSPTPALPVGMSPRHAYGWQEANLFHGIPLGFTAVREGRELRRRQTAECDRNHHPCE